MLVDLLVSAKVGHDGKVTSTPVNITSEWLLASVAVHVSLKRARSGEAFVADSALVLLLCIGRHLRRELTHHRLWCWRTQWGTKELSWSGKGSRSHGIVASIGGGRAVVSGRVGHGTDRAATVVRVTTSRFT